MSRKQTFDAYTDALLAQAKQGSEDPNLERALMAHWEYWIRNPSTAKATGYLKALEGVMRERRRAVLMERAGSIPAR